jgi:hypothetical protein
MKAGITPANSTILKVQEEGIDLVAMFLIDRHRDWIQWAGGLARL